jgi:UDP-N-acetylmuramoyl-tripeptide--D-alanyl-D-alanine ligase
MRWSPETLARATGGRLLQTGERPIASAFIDSRQPRSDGLFVPIVAARDGHDFIAAAAAGGASAALLGVGRSLPPGVSGLTLVEVDDTFEALGRLARDAREQISGPVVAITGSNGKTTTRAFVEATLATAFAPVLCTRGNLNNHLGVPLSLLSEPHAPAAAVLELGMSAPGENDRLAQLVRPSVHVITSIALEHLEFMGSLEAIAAAEAEPIAHLRAGTDGRPPALVLPADERLLLPHLPGPGSGVRVLRVGPPLGAEELDVAITEVEVGIRTRVRLRLRGGESLEVRLATFGAHNARNAASAVAVALHLGLPLGPLVAALEAVEPVGDRGRLHELGPHLVIADCYNANPGSMHVALDSLARLRTQRRGPLVAVLGDMLELGPTAGQLHREIGSEVGRLGLDAVLGFGPLAGEIVEAARAAGVEAAHVSGADGSVEQAVAWVRAQLESGSGLGGAVLFKGSRGLRLERVVAGLLA